MPIDWKIWISIGPPLKLLHATFPLHATEPLQVNDRNTMKCNFGYKSQIVKFVTFCEPVKIGRETREKTKFLHVRHHCKQLKFSHLSTSQTSRVLVM